MLVRNTQTETPLTPLPNIQAYRRSKRRMLPSGVNGLFDNRVNWVRTYTYMKKAALIESLKRGVHKIGRRKENPVRSSPVVLCTICMDRKSVVGNDITSEKTRIPASECDRHSKRDKDNLIQNHHRIDGTCRHDNRLYPFEFNVKAKEKQTSGDDSIFPYPKSISINVNGRADHRVKFISFMLQNNHR